MRGRPGDENRPAAMDIDDYAFAHGCFGLTLLNRKVGLRSYLERLSRGFRADFSPA